MAKRSIFRRIGDFISRKQLDTDTVASNPVYSENLFLNLGEGPEHEISKLIDQASPVDRDPYPREWLPLSRLLYRKIPIYKRAVDLTSEFVGRVTLESDSVSDRTRESVIGFWREIGIYSEVQTRVSDMAGMNSLVRELAKTTLIDGMGFLEERFEIIDGEPSDEYAGALLFDSKHFEYVNNAGTGDLVLRYLANQYPQVDFDTGEKVENPYFHVLKIDNDPRSPWGLPLAAGSEMVSKILAAMLISMELQAKRFGNPPTITTIAPKDLEKLNVEMNLGGTRVSMGDATLQAAKKLKEMIEQAWALSHHGRAAEIVQGFPGPVDLSSRILGEGMSTMVDPDLLWKAAIMLIEGLGVPPVLLNISDTGGGINSDMHRTAVQIFRSRIQSVREKIAPIVAKMTRNYLLSQGINPAELDGIVVAFEDVDLQGEEQRANVRKTSAEADAILIANYEILFNYDIDAASRYAEENGIL
jgi:hypothetical protein